MRKRFMGVMFAATMTAGLAGCGGSGSTSTGAAAADTQATKAQKEEAKDDAKKEGRKEDSGAPDNEGAGDFHIGIITGSVSQSEGSRRGAGASQAMYGKDIVKLVIYPDNFTEELETTIQTIVNLSDDPKMKAIIMNQSVPGTIEAFCKIKETYPDIFRITGKGHEDLPEISSAVNLVCNNDFAAHGYLIIHTAYEFGCDTFMRISFPHHMAYETMSRCVAVMKEAYKEFDMEFVLETAPDPTSDVGVVGAQAYILEKIPEQVEKYGKNATYFCTDDVHTEPLLKQLMEYGGYFIETDLPSPLMDYPGTLGIDLIAETGGFDKIPAKVESTIAERGGADHLGTWAYSYGYTIFADLARHALNVLDGESKFNGTDDTAKAYQVFSPRAEWSGSNYISVETGVKLDNVSLVYQDAYVMGDPGHLMGSTKTEVPEKCFTIE